MVEEKLASGKPSRMHDSPLCCHHSSHNFLGKRAYDGRRRRPTHEAVQSVGGGANGKPGGSPATPHETQGHYLAKTGRVGRPGQRVIKKGTGGRLGWSVGTGIYLRTGAQHGRGQPCGRRPSTPGRNGATGDGSGGKLVDGAEGDAWDGYLGGHASSPGAGRVAWRDQLP
ncbi:hypothetical protein NL676_003723 [Syzygium grande]|nr:hypothetical protein NL676_003723 [Syzygium grande]